MNSSLPDPGLPTRSSRRTQLRGPRATLAGAVAAVLGSSVLLFAPAHADGEAPTECPAVPVSDSATFAYTGEVQTFTVPDSVTSLDITIAGASGGDYIIPPRTYEPHFPGEEPYYDPGSTYFGGTGLKFTTTGEVVGGQELTVVVGGTGASTVSAYGGGRGQGGGGGSFVHTDQTALAIAGGGGGAGYYRHGHDAADGDPGDGRGGPGGGGSTDSGGGGGAGLFTDGGAGGDGNFGSLNATGGVGGSTGPSFAGGAGGTLTVSDTTVSSGTVGGFGGGGGGGVGGYYGGSGAGGGGFTGGAGGTEGIYGPEGGFGGTSYSTTTKSDVSSNRGDGSVTLTWTTARARVLTSFDTTGGSTAPEPQSVDSGCAATAPADPTRDGYTFVGWSNSSTGGSIWDFATPVTSELTLYAQWQPIVPVRDAQTITVTTDPGAPHPGDTYIPGASSTSNLPVAVTLGPDSAQVCHLSGTTVSFDAPGTCDIRYDQEGDASYTAADQVTQQVVVSKAPSSVAVTFGPAGLVFGQAGTVHVVTTDTTTGDPLEGTVRVLIDGDPLPEVATSHGVADVSLNGPVGDTLAAGTHQIEVSFTPSDANHDSAHSSSVLVIAQAQTTTGLIVTGTEVVAAVAAAAPAHGNPTGTVTFYLEQRNIGTATVHDGVARLAYTVPAGAERSVSAVFTGSTNWAPSSDSTVRRDPTITAHMTSAQPKSGSGWYRTPVTVRFTCTSHGAELSGPCPSPVVLSRNGGAQNVMRTVHALDGGVATVAVTGINIDRTGPRLHVAGVRNRAIYAVAPALRCRAGDTVSGISSCRITTKAVRGRHTKTKTYTYRAVAVDRAGNRTVRTGSYRVLRAVVAGAPLRNGAFVVQTGHTYTFVVTSKTRPVYYYPAVSPGKPTGPGHGFVKAGRNRWTLGVTINPGMGKHSLWNAGVKYDGTRHAIRLRVR